MKRRSLCTGMMLVLMLAACDLPRDPEDTLERVTGGTMRVGISANPPWTTVAHGRVGGIETALVEAFAGELGSRVEWVHGTETDLLEALHRFELDLVVAGLTNGTAWKGKVGLTRPYVQTTSLIGLPPSIELPGGSIEGQKVAVPPGDAVAARVRNKDAEPVPITDLATAQLPVAAEDWQLAAWDFTPTSITFASHKHVMAAPPGENGFLVRLERFLAKRSEEVRLALSGEAAR